MTRKLTDNIYTFLDTEQREKNKEKNYLIIINEYPTNCIIDSFNNYRDMPLFTLRANDLTNDDIQISHTSKNHLITIKKDGTNLTIKYPDINNFIGKKDNISKIFVLILAKINEQAIGIIEQDGQKRIKLINEYINFNIEELIELGIYGGKNAIKVAKKGLYTCYQKLAKLEVEMIGNLKKTKHRKNIQRQRFLFNGYDRVGRQVSIKLSMDGLFSYMSYKYFTIIPKWAFKLNNRAFVLLSLIFQRARYETKNITDQEIKSNKFIFNISMEKISEYLAIPNPKKTDTLIGTAHHTEDIKRPILKAIEDIELTYNNEIKKKNASLKNYDSFIDIQILLKQKKIEKEKIQKQTIQDFLKQYIEITLKGKIAEYFINIKKKQTAKIEKK